MPTTNWLMPAAKIACAASDQVPSQDRVLGPTEDIALLFDSLLERFSELVQLPR